MEYQIWYLKRGKTGLTDTSANALLFFLSNLIKYAYSWGQEEPFKCILYEISGFTKGRESLKITSEREVSCYSLLYILA